jgi:hypothetical protein
MAPNVAGRSDWMAAAERLARLHYQLEDGVTQIFLLTHESDGANGEGEPPPIRLLEVNENTAAAGIVPIGFGPAPNLGVPFPSIIVEVTPEEFSDLCESRLALPPGWSVGPEIPRLDAATAE